MSSIIRHDEQGLSRIASFGQIERKLDQPSRSRDVQKEARELAQEKIVAAADKDQLKTRVAYIGAKVEANSIKIAALDKEITDRATQLRALQAKLEAIRNGTIPISQLLDDFDGHRLN